jgi:hypothetical protein
MTALEIRQDEIGSIAGLAEAHEAYKARRARMMGVKPPAPKPVIVRTIPNREHLRNCPRPEHYQDATLYVAPIGPIRVRDWLNITSPKETAPITAKRIMAEICALYGVAHVDLISNRRTHRLVLPRQHACYRLRTETPFSLPQIGRLMGGRDHTSILYSIRKFEAQRDAGKLVLTEPPSLAAE